MNLQSAWAPITAHWPLILALFLNKLAESLLAVAKM